MAEQSINKVPDYLMSGCQRLVRTGFPVQKCLMSRIHGSRILRGKCIQIHVGYPVIRKETHVHISCFPSGRTCRVASSELENSFYLGVEPEQGGV